MKSQNSEFRIQKSECPALFRPTVARFGLGDRSQPAINKEAAHSEF
jgi:hypothetical protein